MRIGPRQAQLAYSSGRSFFVAESASRVVSVLLGRFAESSARGRGEEGVVVCEEESELVKGSSLDGAVSRSSAGAESRHLGKPTRIHRSRARPRSGKEAWSLAQRYTPHMRVKKQDR